jgi:hypothetical protein
MDERFPENAAVRIRKNTFEANFVDGSVEIRAGVTSGDRNAQICGQICDNRQRFTRGD